MHMIDVASHLRYEAESSTILLLNIAAAKTQHQTIMSENLVVEPFTQAMPLHVDATSTRFHRLIIEPGITDINYTARVALTPLTDNAPTVGAADFANLPPDVLTYLNPSRYCESDRIARLASDQFKGLSPDYDGVNAICDWVCSNLSYESGTTTNLTTACDVMLQRTGVCRDFAHLGISLCRAIGVPARYVSGYACRLEPPDFHGFFEAYLDGHWYLFDPTRLAPPAGLVRIGSGRDAADAAFATIWGKANLLEIQVSASEGSDTEQLLDVPPGQMAVSTA